MERGRHPVCAGSGGDRGEREVRQLLPGVDRTDLLAGAETLVDRRDGEGHRARHGRRGGPERAERMDEQHQLVRHQGRGEPARSVRGSDVRRCQARRQERHRLGQPGERPGLQRGARVRGNVVRRAGKPGRVRHPFQHRVQVVDDGCLGLVRHPIRRGARDRPRPPVRPLDRPARRLERRPCPQRHFRPQGTE